MFLKLGPGDDITDISTPQRVSVGEPEKDQTTEKKSESSLKMCLIYVLYLSVCL